METIEEALHMATTTVAPGSEGGTWYPAIDLTGDPTGTVKKAADAAAKLVAEMQAGAPPRWLTITGLQGSGKTLLARQIMGQAVRLNPGGASLWIGDRRRPRCVWLDETKFAEALRTDSGLPEYLRDDFLVVIDDLGTARERWDMVADGLYRLANARLGRWTVWTSNLTHDEITKIDARLASRLIRDGSKGVRITAPDYALRKRPEKTGGEAA